MVETSPYNRTGSTNTLYSSSSLPHSYIGSFLSTIVRSSFSSMQKIFITCSCNESPIHRFVVWCGSGTIGPFGGMVDIQQGRYCTTVLSGCLCLPDLHALLGHVLDRIGGKSIPHHTQRSIIAKQQQRCNRTGESSPAISLCRCYAIGSPSHV